MVKFSLDFLNFKKKDKKGVRRSEVALFSFSAQKTRKDDDDEVMKDKMVSLSSKRSK
jgi:hypothetical protein